MRLLLDTVTFIWAASSPDRLSRTAATALRSEAAIREVSAVSLSEIAIKQSRGKLGFDRNDVEKGIVDLRVRVLPYTGEHALRLFGLPPRHADPFDRQIIAQALVEEVRVVTPDASFDLYEGLRIIW